MAGITFEDVGNYLSVKESTCRRKAAEYNDAGKPVLQVAYLAAAEAYADAIGVVSLAVNR